MNEKLILVNMVPPMKLTPFRAIFRTFVILTCAVFASAGMATALQAQTTSKKLIFVKNFVNDGGMSDVEALKYGKDGKDVKDYVSEAIIGTGLYRIKKDVEALNILKASKQEKMLGCDDDKCMRQIMQTIKTDLLIYGSVRKDGDVLVIKGKILDRSGARIELARVKTIRVRDMGAIPSISKNLGLYLISGKTTIALKKTTRLTEQQRGDRAMKALYFSAFPGLGQMMYGGNYGLIEGSVFMGATLVMGPI